MGNKTLLVDVCVFFFLTSNRMFKWTWGWGGKAPIVDLRSVARGGTGGTHHHLARTESSQKAHLGPSTGASSHLGEATVKVKQGSRGTQVQCSGHPEKPQWPRVSWRGTPPIPETPHTAERARGLLLQPTLNNWRNLAQPTVMLRHWSSEKTNITWKT